MPKTPEHRREYHAKYEARPEVKAARRKWHAENRRLNNARKNEVYWKDPETGRKRERQWRLARKEAAAGRPRPQCCEICGSDKRKIDFDHCHQRGIFRGWICHRCNTILGYVEDDPNHLLKLAAYLQRTAKLIPPQFTLPGI